MLIVVFQAIPQDLLRKYIMYAREKVRPKLYDMDQEKMSTLFADLRRESMITGSYPITLRHLESMIRMAEASAKMALREYVRSDDIDLAIEVAVGSFVSAQKMSIKKTLQRVRISHTFIAMVVDVPCRVSVNTSHNPRITTSYWRSCLAVSSRTEQGTFSSRNRHSQNW